MVGLIILVSLLEKIIISTIYLRAVLCSGICRVSNLNALCVLNSCFHKLVVDTRLYEQPGSCYADLSLVEEYSMCSERNGNAY